MYWLSHISTNLRNVFQLWPKFLLGFTPKKEIPLILQAIKFWNQGCRKTFLWNGNTLSVVCCTILIGIFKILSKTEYVRKMVYSMVELFFFRFFSSVAELRPAQACMKLVFLPWCSCWLEALTLIKTVSGKTMMIWVRILFQKVLLTWFLKDIEFFIIIQFIVYKYNTSKTRPLYAFVLNWAAYN